MATSLSHLLAQAGCLWELRFSQIHNTEQEETDEM